jgi:hypothetical protein
MPSDHEEPGRDELLFRLPNKKLLGLRGSDPIFDLLDPVRHRAGDCGCGKVSRDELIAALLVGALRSSDDELHDLISAYRRTRVEEVTPEAVAGP